MHKYIAIVSFSLFACLTAYGSQNLKKGELAFKHAAELQNFTTSIQKTAKVIMRSIELA